MVDGRGFRGLLRFRDKSHCTRLREGGKGMERGAEMIKKTIGVFFAGVAFFTAGYQYAAALYGEDIAALREDYANRAYQLEEKHRAQEQIQYSSLVAAWEERDKALTRVDSLAVDVERVRKQADAYKRRLSEIADGPCKPCQLKLAECAGLLERGAGVAGRCADVAQRIAVDKDAVVKIVGQ